MKEVIITYHAEEQLNILPLKNLFFSNDSLKSVQIIAIHFFILIQKFELVYI